MKKTLLYIFSLSCLTVYILSSNREFMMWWADFRTYELEAPYAKARYGDLYSNCFLPGFLDTAYIPLKEHRNEKENVDLYIIHDSYLAGKIKKENFKGLHKLFSLDYGAARSFVPDVTKKNILVIECSERNAFWRLTDTATIYTCLNTNAPSPWKQPENTNDLANVFFNPNINQNLEFSLYDYEYFIPLKEWKADLNYSLFKRLPPDVAITQKEDYLLLSETVEKSSPTSSFTELDAAFLEFVTKQVNAISAHYKTRGFDEVYFSIIPNPVSILDQLRRPYNHKIELLEAHPSLKARYISTYFLFLHYPQKIYRTDDSHWNGNGLQLWVDEVNKRLVP